MCYMRVAQRKNKSKSSYMAEMVKAIEEGAMAIANADRHGNS